MLRAYIGQYLEEEKKRLDDLMMLNSSLKNGNQESQIDSQISAEPEKKIEERIKNKKMTDNKIHNINKSHQDHRSHEDPSTNKNNNDHKDHNIDKVDNDHQDHNINKNDNDYKNYNIDKVDNDYKDNSIDNSNKIDKMNQRNLRKIEKIRSQEVKVKNSLIKNKSNDINLVKGKSHNYKEDVKKSDSEDQGSFSEINPLTPPNEQVKKNLSKFSSPNTSFNVSRNFGEVNKLMNNIRKSSETLRPPDQALHKNQGASHFVNNFNQNIPEPIPKSIQGDYQEKESIESDINTIEKLKFDKKNFDKNLNKKNIENKNEKKSRFMIVKKRPRSRKKLSLNSSVNLGGSLMDKDMFKRISKGRINLLEKLNVSCSIIQHGIDGKEETYENKGQGTPMLFSKNILDGLMNNDEKSKNSIKKENEKKLDNLDELAELDEKDDDEDYDEDEEDRKQMNETLNPLKEELKRIDSQSEENSESEKSKNLDSENFSSKEGLWMKESQEENNGLELLDLAVSPIHNNKIGLKNTNSTINEKIGEKHTNKKNINRNRRDSKDIRDRRRDSKDVNRNRRRDSKDVNRDRRRDSKDVNKDRRRDSKNSRNSRKISIEDKYFKRNSSDSQNILASKF